MNWGISRMVVGRRICVSVTTSTSVGSCSVSPVWHSEDLGRSIVAAHMHLLIAALKIKIIQFVFKLLIKGVIKQYGTVDVVESKKNKERYILYHK